MENNPLGHMIAIPHADTVDAFQLRRNELENNATWNEISKQTAAAIGKFILF